MSKKATRRAARQAFPKAPPKPDRSKTYGQRPPRQARSRPTRSAGGARPLRPPSVKRAAIQGAILAVLYLVIIRFFWTQPGTSTLTYILMPVLGFIIYTGVAYGIDKFTYQRRLRRLKDSSK